jgi:hypothetical protein
VTDSRDEHEPYGFTESPVIASIDLGDLVALQAAIVRLTAERDEARQMYCNAMTDHCEEHEARQIAKEQGWDCFKEDGK